MLPRVAALLLSVLLMLPGFARAAVACAVGGMTHCCCEHAAPPEGVPSAGNVDACGCELKQAPALPSAEAAGPVAPDTLAVTTPKLTVPVPDAVEAPLSAPVPPGLGARAPPPRLFLLHRALLV